MENQRYIDPMYKGPSLIRGYLKKLKSDSAFGKFLSKFNKRYFILDMNAYTFGYQDKESSNNTILYPLSDLLDVDPNPRITVVCDWKFGFVVEIRRRIYTLYADSVSVHNEWCTALKACVRPVQKLKQDEINVVNELESIESLKGTNSRPQTNEPEKVYINTLSGPVPGPNEYLKHKVPSEQEIEVNKTYVDYQIYNKSTVDSHIDKPEYPIKDVTTISTSLALHEEPQLITYKGEYSSEQQPKNYKKLEDQKALLSHNIHDKKSPENSDEEISTISGPKRPLVKDDLDHYVPIIQIKDTFPKKIEKKTEPKIEKKTEPKESVEEAKIKVKQETKTELAFKSTGILDMMNDMNNLGLETVEIRPLTRSKPNPKVEPNVKVEHKENTSKPSVPDKPESVKPEKKNVLGNLVVRPVSKNTPARPKYVEKPDVVPDEEVAKPTPPPEIQKPMPHFKKSTSVKAEFKEKNSELKPQGEDYDWDAWD